MNPTPQNPLDRQPSYQPIPPLYPAPDAPQSTTTVTVDAEIERKHRESVAKYPELHLSPNEYVLSSVKRHPIGLVGIWFITVLVAVITFGLLPVYAQTRTSLAQAFGFSVEAMPSAAVVAIPMLVILLLFVVGSAIATIVYLGNKFFVTNESVVQILQTSLFSVHEQTVNLKNIEDASYRQIGILQHLFNYGSLRLSTEGDETTYRFNYVANPQLQARIVVDAMEQYSAPKKSTSPPPPPTQPLAG